MTYLLDPCTDPSVTNRPSNCLAAPVAPACSTANMTSGSPLYPSYQCGIAYSFGYKNITNYTIGARETDVGFYAEDDWKVKPNLTFSYGIRMEAQNAINSSHDFAPRLAIAYGVPRKNGKTTTVIRGGFGVFFNRFGLGSIEGQIANNGVNAENYTYVNPATTCQPTYNSTTGEFTNYDPSCKAGTGAAAKVSPTLNDPKLRSPYTAETAATLEQQVGKYASVTVTYLNARGFHQFMTRSLPVAYTVGCTTTVSNANLLSCNQSEGIYRQNQINTSINIRTPKGMNIGGFYSANWANSNDAQMSDPFSSSVDYGRARFGVRSRLTLFGSFPLPFQISASPMLTAQSGSPYNITVGIPDPVTLGGSDRPSWAGSGPMPAYGSWAQCINAANFSTTSGLNLTSGTNTEIPLNFCTGPATVSLSLRLSRDLWLRAEDGGRAICRAAGETGCTRRSRRPGRAGRAGRRVGRAVAGRWRRLWRPWRWRWRRRTWRRRRGLWRRPRHQHRTQVQPDPRGVCPESVQRGPVRKPDRQLEQPEFREDGQRRRWWRLWRWRWQQRSAPNHAAGELQLLTDSQRQRGAARLLAAPFCWCVRAVSTSTGRA